MLYNIAIFIFVIVCLLLIGIILIQSSKTGGMGAAMSGQAFQDAFGGQGADRLLLKITSFLAIAFMFLAMVIGILPNPGSETQDRSKSILMGNTKSDNIQVEIPSSENNEQDE